MKQKLLSWGLVKYELRNLIGNPFIVFFGFVFPILMSVLLSVTTTKQVPETVRSQVITSLFITMSMIGPLAIILIGYAVNYSQELENDIPLRMKLFGFRERSILLAKMMAQLIGVTVALLIYTIVDFILLDIQTPTLTSALCLIISLYILSAVLFILAHGIATLFRKFGPTYAVTMILYFFILILTGMMGITVDQMPKVLNYIAKALPMTYISNDYVDFWQGGSYNFVPFIQSLLLLAAVSGIVLIVSLRRNRRTS